MYINLNDLSNVFIEHKRVNLSMVNLLKQKWTVRVASEVELGIFLTFAKSSLITFGSGYKVTVYHKLFETVP